MVLVVEVIPNPHQEHLPYTGEARMGYRLSNGSQRRNELYSPLKIIGESVGSLLSVLTPPLGSLANLVGGARRDSNTEAQLPVLFLSSASRS